MRNLRGPEGERFPRREFSLAVAEGVAVCRECHAIHQNKRWAYDEMQYQKLSREGVEEVVCPGCTAVKNRKVEGLVTLKSPMVSAGDGLMNLIRHEADKERMKNPLARIVTMEQRTGELEIQTTTTFLATRLGHAVEHAYQGQLRIDKLPYEKFTRVIWTREE